jgi:hypothetical protein
LVTGELERRWNQALDRVRELELRIEAQAAIAPSDAPELAQFADLAEQLDRVWNDPKTDPALKKRIVRTLIEEVVADVDSEGGEIRLAIHSEWYTQRGQITRAGPPLCEVIRGGKAVSMITGRYLAAI